MLLWTPVENDDNITICYGLGRESRRRKIDTMRMGMEINLKNKQKTLLKRVKLPPVSRVFVSRKSFLHLQPLLTLLTNQSPSP